MKILFTEEQLEKRVKELGREISEFYQEKPVTLVAVLNGGMIFAADLMRCLKNRVFVDSVAASCYDGDVNTGNLQIRSVMKYSPAGKNILLVDDVFDTGFSLRNLAESMKRQGAADVRICVILDKSANEKSTKPDWIGFHVSQSDFVVGYGMDYNEEYRNLPFIAVLKD